MDKRSLEKCLGAAGSSLGGVRERGEMKRRSVGNGLSGGGNGGSSGRELKDGFTFGQGEWKGLVELNVGFVEGGPGSDEVRFSLFFSLHPVFCDKRITVLTKCFFRRCIG